MQRDECTVVNYATSKGERNGGGGGEGLRPFASRPFSFPLCRDNNSQTFLILFKLNFSNQNGKTRTPKIAQRLTAQKNQKRKEKKKFRPVMYRSLSPSHPPLWLLIGKNSTADGAVTVRHLSPFIYILFTQFKKEKEETRVPRWPGTHK